MDSFNVFIGFLILGMGGVVGSMYSLEVGRMGVHEKMEDIFGEDYITSNCDGSGTTFDCDVYNKEGKLFGRYHEVAAWGYILDHEGAYQDAQIIKLEGVE